VKPAIRRIIIFSPAERTQGETGHGRVDPIVGDIFDNRQTWAAVCAVDKRVTKSSILGIKKLRETLAARGNIRRNIDLSQSAGFTFDNPESRIFFDFYLGAGNL
jgi:hypothetical protein